MLRKALPIETAATEISVTPAFLLEQVEKGKLKGYLKQSRFYFIETDLKNIGNDNFSLSDNPLLNEDYKVNIEELKTEEENSDEYWDETCDFE